MESDNYRTWRLGPIEFGFENEWRSSAGMTTYFLLGAGAGDFGPGAGLGILGLVAHIEIRKPRPPVESLGRAE